MLHFYNVLLVFFLKNEKNCAFLCFFPCFCCKMEKKMLCFVVFCDYSHVFFVENMKKWCVLQFLPVFLEKLEKNCMFYRFYRYFS